ncbi:DUF1007 family protein [Mesorhizobium sp. M7A.F.Ca.US.008.03.1.1]|uniref:DUF1007 family protein n=1 Tax=Mesorhizobium sp. M7A.F.Ca.US.008.03.1.1 TaxID=2496742 RepID=UPI0013E05EB1|nr:DUF1007 family protein [Mesorhizobium sp. M7A.F.Ca.US.008.03.1.1]
MSVMLLAGVLAPNVANAHPHVFAEARLALAVDNNTSTISSLRHFWRFDELFSSAVMMEFDKDSDLQLSSAEMQAVSETVYASLAEYNYFQIVTVDGRDIPMSPPPALKAEFDKDQLIISFESKPKEPLKLSGKVDFGIYDPSFYTAIDFIKDDDIVVEGLPATCKPAVIRPNADDAIAQNQKTLTDAFFNDPTGTDMSKIFATKLELTCLSRE